MGAVSEQEKLAFIFHDGQDAHLVLRTTLDSGSGLPERMAWVIPISSLPSKYEEVSGELFEELWNLIPRRAPAPTGVPSPKGDAPKAAPAPAIVVHEKQIVGSYQIQPIEILSESAGSELNAWLSKNGFGPVPAENQNLYLKKGVGFSRAQGRRPQRPGIRTETVTHHLPKRHTSSTT